LTDEEILEKLMSKFSLLVLLVCSLVTNGCSQKNDKAPQITDIKTSSKVLAKSDCIPTSETITANITDDIGVQSAALWYRIGQDQKFTSAPMKREAEDTFEATIIALDIPGGEYGALEFYIAAEDQAGNQSKSEVDRSVHLLACVAN
jgi:hypothetical protein